MNNADEKRLVTVIGILTRILGIVAVLPVLFMLWLLANKGKPIQPEPSPLDDTIQQPVLWSPPDLSLLTGEEKENILYGKALIVNTAYYLGPEGTVAHNGNGMNCQNCHLDAGTKIFGNNFSSVAANYPKFRERSGTVESVRKRINDCIERSLNGAAIDTLSKEMLAMEAYILWLGTGMPKGEKVKGSGIAELAYLSRAANPEEGAEVYIRKCMLCHALNGEGKKQESKSTFEYPPLWGDKSFNTGAGLFRLSRMAGYIKSNMPYGVTYDKPQLTDEEAWDVAAFVNSRKRPVKNLSTDWPHTAAKPVDLPFGPYTDPYSEQQHKYGPFQPIVDYYKNTGKR